MGEIETEKTVLNFLSVLGVALMRTHTMGDLPNEVRTALVGLEAKETQLLASLLLRKKAEEIQDSNSLSKAGKLY